MAGIRVVFHVPLHETLALQGTLPAHILAISTLLLIPLGLFISAAVTRFCSMWPAVFAHALPLSAFTLIGDPELPSPARFWTFTALGAAVLVLITFLVAPRSTPTSPRRYQRDSVMDPGTPGNDGMGQRSSSVLPGGRWAESDADKVAPEDFPVTTRVYAWSATR